MDRFIVVAKSESIERKIAEVMAINGNIMAFDKFRLEVARRVGFEAFSTITPKEVKHYLDKRYTIYWLSDHIVYRDDASLEKLGVI